MGSVSYTHLDVYKRQVKGNIAGQDAGKDGRGCGNQHEADRVHQHLSLIHILKI